MLVETPDNWRDGLAFLADRFATMITALSARIDDQGNLIEQTAKARADMEASFKSDLQAVGALFDPVNARIDTVIIKVADDLVTRSVADDLVTRSVADADTRRVADREALEAVIAQAVTETGGRISAVEGVLNDHEERFAAAAVGIAGANVLAERANEAASAADTLAVRAGEDVAAVRARVERASEDLATVDARVEQLAGAVDQVATVRARVDQLADTVDIARSALDQARELSTRVTIALASVPSGFMIDQGGNLVRTDRSGESVTVGRVAARDGADAPEIVAAKVESGRLIFTRSDRTEFSCVLPIDPPAPPPVVAVEPVKPMTDVEEMSRLRALGGKYSAIAAKFGISERTAARTIKAFNDAQAKKSQT